MVALGWLKEDGSPSDLALQGFKTPSQGATTTLWVATSPMLKDIGGIYCENCNVAQLKSEFENPEASRYIGVADWAVSKEDAKRLWDYSENFGGMVMISVKDAIKNRFSVRAFTDQEVPKDVIGNIINLENVPCQGLIHSRGKFMYF